MRTSEMNKKRPGGLPWLKIGIGVAVAALAWFVVGQPAMLRRQARHDTQELLTAANVYVREHGAYPTGDFATICKLLRGESVDGQNPRRLDYIEANVSEMNANGEFIDPWGVPYRLTFTGKIRAYSCGPNRVDESGNGDDLVAE